MKLATFNINGIKARVDALPAWLATAAPDVVCLQEIKSVNDAFPREVFEAMGYRVETHGQKGFNGVAILSKLPLTDIRRGLPGDEADEQARWIEAVVTGARPLRICGLYLPNGNPAPGPKYDYKLAWMARMEARVRDLLAAEEPFVCLGDYNVIPQALDAAKPENWVTDALYLPASRQAYRRMLHLGLTEAIRIRDAQCSSTGHRHAHRDANPLHNGSTICFSARKPPTGLRTPGSTRRYAAATSRQIMCRSGSRLRPEVAAMNAFPASNPGAFRVTPL